VDELVEVVVDFALISASFRIARKTPIENWAAPRRNGWQMVCSPRGFLSRSRSPRTFQVLLALDDETRMRRLCIGLFVLACVMSRISDASAESREDSDHHLAGTYWLSIQGDFPSLPGLLVLTADGRIIATEAQGPETTGLGTWEARGRRSVAGTFIWFLALNPAPGPDGGRYTLIGKVDFKGEFDHGGKAATLPFTIGIFSIDQNPLVDAPLFSFPGVMTATRLTVAR